MNEFEIHLQAAKDYADAALAHAQKGIVEWARNASDPKAFNELLTSQDPAVEDSLYETLDAAIHLPQEAQKQIELAKVAQEKELKRRLHNQETALVLNAAFTAAETYVNAKLALAATLNSEGQAFVMKIFLQSK